ncbi:MAG: PEP-CTERM sorting domain-containing protein [Tepidisphaeraceae bacterium]
MPSNRLRKVCPALAGAALVGLGAAAANAALTIDVVAVGSTGTSVISGGGKSVTGMGVGDVITFDVFARLPNADGNAANDNVNIVWASFLSTNIGGGAVLGTMSMVTPDAAFLGLGHQNGVQQDLDTDTDLDLGSNVNTSGVNFYGSRATVGAPGPAGANQKLGTLTMTITSLLGGTETDVNARKRQTTTGYNFTEDGVPTINSNNVALGTPVVFTGGGGGVIPEPATMGLVALGALGTLARRRR